MLYLYESTKLSSLPLASCMVGLCSSIDWKEASWVTVPSVSVSRQGLVMPFLDRSLFTTLAVRRNCLICSLVRVGSSDAVTKGMQVKHTAAARISLGQRRSTRCMGITSIELSVASVFPSDVPQSFEALHADASCSLNSTPTAANRRVLIMGIR